MTRRIRCTLTTDGSSDRLLKHPLQWLLEQHFPDAIIELDWADPQTWKGMRMDDRLRGALLAYPCDILLVHRDAEAEQPEVRQGEIRSAAEQVGTPPIVPVIPIRMTESWLLHDEQAIRMAAGNPNGTTRLELPRIGELERIAEPKRLLFRALETASGLRGRRRQKFAQQPNLARCRQLVAERIESWDPLRSLAAFRAVEARIAELAEQQGIQ